MSDQSTQPEKDLSANSSTEPQPERSTEELLAEAQAKLEQSRSEWLRALADADNARKRAQSEVAQARKYAAETVVGDLLPVMDSLEAALGTGETDQAALRSGIELTRKQLQAALERAGVTELNPAPGQRFDPHRHQAMAAVDSGQEPNTVVQVLQKGYALQDRVVRPALVTVAKAPAVENGGGNPISDSSLESN